MSYFDGVELENIPKMPEEVLTIMMDQLQDLRSDLEYISSDQFSQLTYPDRVLLLLDAMKSVRQVQLDQKELIVLMSRTFQHGYYNAIDLIDRLRHATRINSNEMP